MSRLVDALPNMDFMMCMGIAADVRVESSDLYHFQAMVSNTKKPIVFTSWNLTNLNDIYKMCIAVCGNEKIFKNKPFAAFYGMPTTPLKNTEDVCQQIMFCAEKGIPLIYSTGPLMGATSPVTIAGTIALSFAEFLSGLVLAQIKLPGAPVIVGCAPAPFDMQGMIDCHGSPELSIGYMVSKELINSYGLGDFTLAGATESKVVDMQAAADYAWTLTMSCLSGQNLIHDVGYMEGGASSSFDLVVLGDEIISMARKLKNGFELNNETLALDVIKDVGPNGTYLYSDHTLRNFKKEIWYPTLMNRQTYTAWFKEGATDLQERLREKVISILDEHKTEPLAEFILKEIENIISINLSRYKD